MGIFLQIIGGIVFCLFLLIGLGILSIKFKLRKLKSIIKTLGSPLVGIRIRLEPVESIRWLDPNLARLYCRDLENAGFVPCGSYKARPVSGIYLAAFVNEQLNAYAYVTQVAMIKAIYIDIDVDYSNNTELCVTNGEDHSRGHARPEWSIVIREVGASVNRLIELLKENEQPGERIPAQKTGVAITYEDHFARGVKWRYENGSIPIPNIAALESLFHVKSDPETVEFIRDLNKSGVFLDKVKTAYGEASSCSREDCEGLIFVHSKMLPENVTDLLLDDTQHKEDLSLAVSQARVKYGPEIFADLLTKFKIEDRFQKLGDFKEPFEFAVYRRIKPIVSD